MRRDLALKKRQKPAGRGDAVGAEANELIGGGKEFVEQPFRPFANDAAW